MNKHFKGDDFESVFKQLNFEIVDSPEYTFDSRIGKTHEITNASFEVSDPSTYHILNKSIKLFGYIADPQSLIDIYDEHNIMILPSYTEGTPYVVDESLSRKRPVIIFEDIDYIVRGKKGIFVTKRDIDSFLKTSKYIMENYLEIQKNMEKNILPTKKDMIKQISDIIKLENS